MRVNEFMWPANQAEKKLHINVASTTSKRSKPLLPKIKAEKSKERQLK